MVTLEDNQKLLEIFEDQLQSYSLKLEALTKRYKVVSTLPVDAFLPSNPTCPLESDKIYVESIKDNSIANLRLEMAQAKEHLLKLDSVILSINAEIQEALKSEENKDE